MVNGDVADVVIAATGTALSRWTNFTAHRIETMDLTRRLARVEPTATADIGTDPGSPTPLRSCWLPSRSAPQRSVWT